MTDDKYYSNEEFQAEMNTIFNDVAHQWRQPLSRINANVFAIDRLLKNLQIKDASIEDKLLEIEALTKYMSTTLDDFKPKIKDEHQEPFYIEDILTEAKELTLGVLREFGIDFSINIEKNFLLDGYRGKLLQILTVLIYNAKDILQERNTFPAKITIVATQNEKICLLRVCDNGGGISKKNIEKIFDPNFTTKHTSEGSGFGLNILKQIIENDFNGEVSVQNINQGTCFEIKFYRG